MTMTVTKMKRFFNVGGGVRLPDPNPAMSIEEVQAFYAGQFPDIVTAAVSGPEAIGDKLIYSFELRVGSKG